MPPRDRHYVNQELTLSRRFTCSLSSKTTTYWVLESLPVTQRIPGEPSSDQDCSRDGSHHRSNTSSVILSQVPQPRLTHLQIPQISSFHRLFLFQEYKHLLARSYRLSCPFSLPPTRRLPPAAPRALPPSRHRFLLKTFDFRRSERSQPYSGDFLL